MSKAKFFMTVIMSNLLAACVATRPDPAVETGWIRFTEDQPKPSKVQPLPQKVQLLQQKVQTLPVSNTMVANTVAVPTPTAATVKSTPVNHPNKVNALLPKVSTPIPKPKIWSIAKGLTLKQGFTLWAVNQKCKSNGPSWTVRWETDTDYSIDYPLTFNATNFEDATSQLFNLYRTAQAPLYVSGYRNQCLIVISDKK